MPKALSQVTIWGICHCIYRAQLYRVFGHPERTAVQGVSTAVQGVSTAVQGVSTAVQGVGHPESSAVQGAYSM